jgi:hypothetical protein
MFILRGSVLACLIRKPRGTNWASFLEDLKDMLNRGPVISIRNKAGLGLAIN